MKISLFEWILTAAAVAVAACVLTALGIPATAAAGGCVAGWLIGLAVVMALR